MVDISALFDKRRLFEGKDWTTREMALASFCEALGCTPEEVSVDGPDGGPYEFLFVQPAQVRVIRADKLAPLDGDDA
jgi:hypothetical protein